MTLVKSVLSNLPTYYLSLFPAPILVLKEMERLQRNFLWGRRDGVFKHNLVDWNVVCKSICSGGAGIRKLKLHNEALMGKWLWRFAIENSGLWKDIIVSKYGEEMGGWSSAEAPNCFGASLWKCIRRNWSKFDSCISWKVGKGDRILFWKHEWMEDGRLSDLFPDIYRIATDRNALISDYSSGAGLTRVWNVQLQRNLNDWELESFGKLLELLYSIQLDNNDDELVWKQSKENYFTVKSYYLRLLGEDEEDFPWRKLWATSVPPRAVFFSWCAVRGRILTMDNLKIRGYSLANRCSLCFRHEETIDHMFLHCYWATELWNLILTCLGVKMCFPHSIKFFLLAWWGQQMGKRKKKIWNLIPFCLFWLIWKERNRRIFDNKEMVIWRAKSLFLNCLYSWAEEGREIDIGSFLHFVASMQ